MKTRILVGTALVAFLVCLLAFGGYVYAAGLALFSVAAVYEISLAFRKKQLRPITVPLYVFAATFSFVFLLFGEIPLFALYMLCAMTTMVCTVAVKGCTVDDAIASLFLYVYPGILLLCLLLVYLAFPRPVGLSAACMALAAPEFCDALAYFGGTFFGKHKLCPAISPKKTVEGSASAVVGGVLFGLIVFFLQRLWGGSLQLAVLLGLGLAAGVLSQFGDLFASKFKRWAGIKDFSSVFPGHGGIMDRIDSMLFCAPLVLCVVTVLTKLPGA